MCYDESEHRSSASRHFVVTCVFSKSCHRSDQVKHESTEAGALSELHLSRSTSRASS